MTKASHAESVSSDCHRETDAVGRGDPAGLLRREAPRNDRKASLWLWVAGAFLLLVLAWTVMFTVARSAKIQSVPLTTSGGHKNSLRSPLREERDREGTSLPALPRRATIPIDSKGGGTR